ncbi:unnamed protein product, partial [Candidula unifasciata]
ARQMCWSCQYVLRGAGKEECSAAPGNWTGGESRIRCPTKCIITAEFDSVTGEPTFIHRGCGMFQQPDGCLDNGARHSCFYSCQGKNYCNNKKLSKSPKCADSVGTGNMVDSMTFIVHTCLSLFVCYVISLCMLKPT